MENFNATKERLYEEDYKSLTDQMDRVKPELDITAQMDEAARAAAGLGGGAAGAPPPAAPGGEFKQMSLYRMALTTAPGPVTPAMKTQEVRDPQLEETNELLRGMRDLFEGPGAPAAGRT